LLKNNVEYQGHRSALPSDFALICV